MTQDEQTQLEAMLRRAREAAEHVSQGYPDARMLEDARELFDMLVRCARRVDGGAEWLNTQLQDTERPLIRPGILEQIGEDDTHPP
jgi:hypothetical protein